MLHVEDLTNITASEKSELIRMFDNMGLPHVVCETHFVISSDLQHDNAMIQKLLVRPSPSPSPSPRARARAPSPGARARARVQGRTQEREP